VKPATADEAAVIAQNGKMKVKAAALAVQAAAPVAEGSPRWIPNVNVKSHEWEAKPVTEVGVATTVPRTKMKTKATALYRTNPTMTKMRTRMKATALGHEMRTRMKMKMKVLTPHVAVLGTEDSIGFLINF